MINNGGAPRDSTDLISRADAIEAVRKCVVESELLADWNKAMESVQELLSAIPSADAKGANLINRHDATTVIREECWKCNKLINADLLGRILALPTSRQTDCTEFIEWLTEAVLDDEDWELNAVAYGEIICRKLVKLGVLEVTEEPSYYIRPSADADMSEYADRLWKIAYERGKREASAEANPTVVRCKTMIPYGDFREWAKRIREDNPNVIVIPFDAEVVSADAVQGEWIFNGYEKTNKSWFECSVCGSDYFHKHNFCPNCGARMIGGDDE